MTPDLPITPRNPQAKLILMSGARVVLREVLFGEQVKQGGKFVVDVTPMSHGRFRLIQTKGGVRCPVDLTAQNVDRIARRGATTSVAAMAKPAPEDVDVFDVTMLGLPYSGKVEMFNGRGAIHGTDDKTGEHRVVLLQDVQSMDVTRRKPAPRIIPAVASTLEEGEVTAGDAEGVAEAVEVVEVVEVVGVEVDSFEVATEARTEAHTEEHA